MGRIFDNIPPFLIVGVGLLLAVFFLFKARPPVSVCDAQLEITKKNLTPAIFRADPKRFSMSSTYEKSITQCKQSYSLGGCLEFFDVVRKLLAETDRLGLECREKLYDEDAIKNVFRGAYVFFGLIAWGDGPQASPQFVREGWLDSEQVRLFCALKNHLVEAYGVDDLKELDGISLKKLPNPNNYAVKDLYPNSILSVSCQ